MLGYDAFAKAGLMRQVRQEDLPRLYSLGDGVADTADGALPPVVKTPAIS